jgi:serine/threonine protein kinase
MSIQLRIQGGDGWKSRVGPTRADALLTLGDIRFHLGAAGKAKGVLTLVNRTNENGVLTLKRKSGLQLLFRGRNNQRLNDTVETIGKLLENAGLDDAKKELDEYLAADPKRNGNRISAAKLLELLDKQTVEVDDESDSSDGGSRIILPGSVESGSWSELLANSRDSSVSGDGPIIMADAEPLSMSQVQGMMNRQSEEANVSGSMNVDSRAESQVADRQPVAQEQPQPQPQVVDRQPAAPVQQQNAAPQLAAQVQQPVQALRPEQYAGSDVYPPTTVGTSVNELLKNTQMSVPANSTLGKGAFGMVRQLRVQGQLAPMVVKTFNAGYQPILSRGRDGNVNEAIAAYLTSRKDGTYAERVNVVQPEYYLVRKADTYMMLDPLALRALLKDSSSTDGVLCVGMVMKMAEGNEVFSIASQLSEAQRKQVLKGTLQSVSVLNERGFVHRDIKPENAFFDAGSGKVSLIDTGLMHKSSRGKAYKNIVSNMAGTKVYMHPKVWSQQPYGTEADLYSSAMMALELHSPLTMGIIEDDYLVPVNDRIKKGESLPQFGRFFNKERLVNKLNGYLAAFPVSGGTARQQALRGELERVTAELADPNSFSSFIMDCLMVATDPPGEANWRDPGQAADIYRQLLSDPRLN